MDRWLADRAYVRNLFIRLLGVVFLIAFLSLLVQLRVLYGRNGLLPAQAYLDGIRATARFFEVPTVFWIGCSDRALQAAAAAGVVLSFGLIFNVAPCVCLFALWALYLSFVSVGQDFMSFQWDNLLLESAFFSLFVVPGGWRPRHPPPPHPLGTFLMLWLVFRLHFESGAAKLLSGDPTWRDLTAMVSYYETAPIPTWLGWYAHQVPAWGQKFSALFTLIVEIGVAPLIFAPHTVRSVVFVLMLSLQLVVGLTANYGFFNYLSMALCLWVLDDRHIEWAARRLRWTLRPPAARVPARLRTACLATAAFVVVPLSVVPFLHFSPWHGAWPRIGRMLSIYRSVNAYHLFASMTLVRREAVLEGSDDGAHWNEYDFCYKAGDVSRPPPFVAPHQPRVDFQMWFLLLGGRFGAPYFETLLRRLLTDPAAVAPLFCVDPFPDRPPRFVRVAVYQYRFTDYASGPRQWWSRQLLGYSEPITRETLR
jgi:lipase maturation factor